MPTITEENKNPLTKDPYLKPIVFGGLIITMLTILFAPGIFLWAFLGGYVAIRMSYKLIKKMPTLVDSILIGLFSGIIGGTCINILAVISIKTPENKKVLVDTIKKNWPPDMEQIPNINEILPSIIFTTCVLILIICILFSIAGAFSGFKFSKKKTVKKKVKNIKKN